MPAFDTEFCQTLQTASNIVITGDSLSYNHYGFESAFRLNAFDCLPGIPSWSFLVRDAIYHSDPYFVPAERVQVSCKQARSASETPDLPKYAYPFGNRPLSLVLADRDDEVVLYNNHAAPGIGAVLHLGSVPDGHVAAQWDIYVDGRYAATTHNNGAEQLFQGYCPFRVNLPVPQDGWREIRLTNWRPCREPQPAETARPAMAFRLLGLGSRSSAVHLTGQGRQTAQWIMENLESRVTFCRPDVVMLIIGANDRVSRTVGQFEDDLRKIVRGCRAANSGCKLLLISPPSSECEQDPGRDDNHYVPDARSRLYNDRMEEVAVETGCLYIDLLELFSDVPKSKWRIDNVHFTEEGNRLLAETVRRLAISGHA